MKRFLLAAACLPLLFMLFNACGQRAVTPDDGVTATPEPAVLPENPPEEIFIPGVRVLIAYSGAMSDAYILTYFEQSRLADLYCETMDISRLDGLDCDYLFIDTSVLNAPGADAFKQAAVAFVENGGGLFLLNAFSGFFDAAFIGAESFAPVKWGAEGVSFPETRFNLSGLQNALRDYLSILPLYEDYEELTGQDGGVGVVGGTAVALAEADGAGLFTVNRVGDGYVFFASEMLPCKLDAQTTQTANWLLLNGFAAFLCLENRGYAAERVFGTYGRPAAAWQNHYEDAPGIGNDALSVFFEQCERYAQIPSLSLVRNAYTWYLRAESITYLPGDVSAPYQYARDAYENAYSTGKHVAAGGEWLSIASFEDYVSYFDDPPYKQRAYPAFGDFSGNGYIDIISGSSDGYFYYYEGMKQEAGQNFTVNPGRRLTGADGNPLRVSGYSAPTMADVSGDGVLDIISGCEDGAVYLFTGNGDLTFTPEGIIIDAPETRGFSMPCAGSIYGDGVTDLAVGGVDGWINFYKGVKNGNELSFIYEDAVGLPYETFAAPEIIDNGAGTPADLAVGTAHGYIKRLTQDAGRFTDAGYFNGTSFNYKGNNRLKFGNNCVPRFVSLYGGAVDLAVGQLEYGMAAPIDSPYFPHAEALREQLAFCGEKGIYTGVHVLTHKYRGMADEMLELELQKQAFEFYGIPWAFKGANQHTWNAGAFTLNAERRSGLLWNSGYTPFTSREAAQVNAKNTLAQPFYDNGFMLFNTPTFLYGVGGADAVGRNLLPVSMYYHFDSAWKEPEKNEPFIAGLAAFVAEYRYNFVSEDQLVKAVDAAYKFNVNIEEVEEKETGGVLDLYITPSFADGIYAPYEKSVGIRLIQGEKYLGFDFQTDAPVYYSDETGLYAAAGEPFRVWAVEPPAPDTESETPGDGIQPPEPDIESQSQTPASDAESQPPEPDTESQLPTLGTQSQPSMSGIEPQPPAPYITRVNTPAIIGENAVKFLEDGLMLVEIISEADIEIAGSDWLVEHTGASWVIWKIGGAETLLFNYLE